MSTRPEKALLTARAGLLARTRAFFAARGVLEVETPVLGTGLVVDAHIDPIVCDDGGERRYLLPSPEAPMKRLLALGSGPIYRIGPAFRAGEHGPRHRPEFTMLEWYRPGFDDGDLIDEVGALVRELTGAGEPRVIPYADACAPLDLDPHRASRDELLAVARAHGVAFAEDRPEDRRADLLDLLFATCVEPTFDPDVPTFVRDFPVELAALARVTGDDPPVARRFELFHRGLELANGYFELLDVDAHRARFASENERRTERGKPALPPDEDLLAALEYGLPSCAGVALGFDRLVMAALGTDRIADVLPLGS